MKNSSLFPAGFQNKMISFILLILGTFSILNAQNKPPFWEDIQHFKKQDTENPPKSNSILFIGSSSFTMWKDVASYFPDKIIINRGFGGSSIKDLNFYADDLLKPYHPKQIVIYCGENDFASDPELPPKEVFKRFKKFYTTIRTYYPDIDVDYVSIKMSPSRMALWSKFSETNLLIQNYLNKRKNSHYIDITKGMEDASGNVRSELFLEDMLHMKPAGYEIWTQIMKPYLK